jgi:hypothetical protein
MNHQKQMMVNMWIIMVTMYSNEIWTIRIKWWLMYAVWTTRIKWCELSNCPALRFETGQLRKTPVLPVHKIWHMTTFVAIDTPPRNNFAAKFFVCAYKNASLVRVFLCTYVLLKMNASNNQHTSLCLWFIGLVLKCVLGSYLGQSI